MDPITPKLTIPTARELEAEALDLDRRAAMKEQLADLYISSRGSPALRADAAIFREEAASKRAKADRLRTQAALDSLE